MKPRNLDVLNIDDSDQTAFEDEAAYQGRLNIEVIKRWTEAQMQLGPGAAAIRPDIILSDVSFGLDPSLANWNGRRDDLSDQLIPIGLMLALPFIYARDVTVLMPYSHYVQDPKLRRDPHYLLTMGLVAARLSGTVFESSTLHKSPSAINGTTIEEHLEEDKRIRKVAALALREALPLYRDRFKAAFQVRGRMMVTNTGELTRLLQDARKKIKKDGKYELPEDAAVECIGRNGLDRIRLSSLYGDLLGWQRTVDVSTVETIMDDLVPLGRVDPVFAFAVDVCSYVDRIAERVSTTVSVDRAITKLYPKLDRDSKREVMRLCILFANVKAWQDKDVANADGQSPGFSLARVRSQLGMDDVDDKTYLGWFDRRESKEGRAKKNSTQRQVTLGVLGKNDPLATFGSAGDSSDCLLSAQSVLSEEDDHRVEMYLTLLADAKRDGRIPMPYKVMQALS